VGDQADAARYAGGRLVSLPPARILDSRNGVGGYSTPWPGGGAAARDIQVTGRGGVPSTGVSAVVLNVTATNAATDGFLAVYPAGGAWPGNSNVNFAAGQTIPNRVIVPVGAGGRITIASAALSVDVVVDVAGYFATRSTGTYTPVTPARLIDTRFTDAGAIGPGGTRLLNIPGTGGLPTSGVRAVAINVTATNVTAGGYVAIFPHGGAWQVTSDLNTAPGVTATNLVIVQLGADGMIVLANEAGSVDLIADVVGWYS
jgi:hypothetical protein